MKKKLLYVAGILTLLWGVSHLFPTASVVKDFGDISFDNKLIITMEWIVEGVALIFLGLLTIIVTKTDTESKLAKNVYISIVGAFTLTIVSLFTGFRISFIPFRLCPIIFSTSAILIIVGMRLKLRTQERKTSQ
jgi:CHASE2 domain-containing sensor protein